MGWLLASWQLPRRPSSDDYKSRLFVQDTQCLLRPWEIMRLNPCPELHSQATESLNRYDFAFGVDEDRMLAPTFWVRGAEGQWNPFARKLLEIAIRWEYQCCFGVAHRFISQRSAFFVNAMRTTVTELLSNHVFCNNRMVFI